MFNLKKCLTMVQYLKYRGKEYPIKLGNYSLRRFQEENGVDLSNAKEDESLYEPLLFFALKQGARYEKQELDLVREDMIDVLDDCMMEFIQAIPKFFIDSIPEELREQFETELSKLVVEEAKKPKVKKQTGTSSKPKQ